MKIRRMVPSGLILAAAGAVILFSGCGGANDLVQGGTISENEMVLGAQTGGMAGPSGDTAGEMITGMAGLIQPGVAPMVGGNVSAAISAPTCDPTFDLGNGITGTCSVDAQGVFTYSFSGVVDVDGDSVAVDGTMTATPSASQPTTGSSYDITYDATASGSRGTATWSATGTVLLDDLGVVTDYTLNMTHTITPAGGSTVVVTMTVTPGVLNMTFTGPMGGTMTLSLDRDTMSGSLSMNGIQVATLTIANGCVNINSTVPGVPDQQVCPQT